MWRPARRFVGDFEEASMARGRSWRHQYEILEFDLVLSSGTNYTLKVTFSGSGFSFDCVTVKNQGIPQ